MICVYLFILLCILVILILYKNNQEHYTDLKIEYEILNSVNGYNEGGLDNEYDTLNTNNTYHRYKGVQRYDQLYANQWNTRQPGVINQQYSYNDVRVKNPLITDSIVGAANLDELSINYVNKNIGVMDPLLSKLSLEYYPDVRPRKIVYNKNRCEPHYKLTSKKVISGFDPDELLPAEYADRSKTSKEFLLSANLIEARRDELGYLPSDNIGPI